MASPGSDDGVVSAPAVVVCCMCGDHGLPHQLFRCNLCRLRTQHRYCSDLYPRVVGPYRSCNWCLTQGGAGAGGADSLSPVKAPAASAWAKRRINYDSRGDDDDRDNDESACYGRCSRSTFSSDPGKPIKKPKKGHERAAQRPPEPAVTTTVSKKSRREVQPAGKPRRFKVKVQRYKLLAEVIC